jgi:hypothetical protein
MESTDEMDATSAVSKYQILEGQMLCHLPGILFIKIVIDGSEETCFCRSHRIYIDGKR